MKIEYDPEVDALYIELRAASPVESMDIAEGVTVDLDKDGHVVGLEILDASETLRDNLARIELTGLPLWELPGKGRRRAANPKGSFAPR